MTVRRSRSAARRQRALLARLLLDPGRTVSIDALLEDLWGEDQPPTAVKMIHVAVSQLRKVLPAGALQTRAPGYAAHGATDLQRFEELRAAGRLREALALWRGPALAEFDAPFAGREGARLEELRLGCLEERIEADLVRGEHALDRARAGGPRRRQPAARAPAASAHARALPLRPPGGGAGGLPRLPRDPRRGAGDRAVGRAARARALAAAPGRARARARSSAAQPAARRELRGQRRRLDRLSGHRRRTAGHRARARLGVQLPARLGASGHRALLRAPRGHGQAHPLRQARHRAVGPRGRDRVARGAHGRHARGARRGRLRARRSARRERGRPHVRALRGDLPGAHGGPRRHGVVRAPQSGPRLPDRRPPAGVRARGLGPPRRATVRRGARALALRGRGRDRLVRLLPRARREPGRGPAHPADEPRDRRPPRAADDPGARARAVPRGGVPARRDAVHGRRTCPERGSSPSPVPTTCRGRATRRTCCARSRPSSPPWRTAPSPIASWPRCCTSAYPRSARRC